MTISIKSSAKQGASTEAPYKGHFAVRLELPGGTVWGHANFTKQTDEEIVFNKRKYRQAAKGDLLSPIFHFIYFLFLPSPPSPPLPSSTLRMPTFSSPFLASSSFPFPCNSFYFISFPFLKKEKAEIVMQHFVILILESSCQITYSYSCAPTNEQIQNVKITQNRASPPSRVLSKCFVQ